MLNKLILISAGIYCIAFAYVFWQYFLNLHPLYLQNISVLEHIFFYFYGLLAGIFTTVPIWTPVLIKSSHLLAKLIHILCFFILIFTIIFGNIVFSLYASGGHFNLKMMLVFALLTSSGIAGCVGLFQLYSSKWNRQ